MVNPRDKVVGQTLISITNEQAEKLKALAADNKSFNENGVPRSATLIEQLDALFKAWEEHNGTSTQAPS